MNTHQVGAVLALATLGLITAPAITAWAQTDGGQIIVNPLDPAGRYNPPTVNLGAQSPGSAGQPGGGETQPAGTGAGSGGPVCTYTQQDDAWGNRYSQLEGFGPMKPGQHIYEKVCNGLMTGWVFMGPVAPAAPVPTPAQLAQQAYRQLQLPLPTPRHSPDLTLGNGAPSVVVGEHTWVWTDPQTFVPQSKRVQVGAVWALVTATPTGLGFDPGNGDPAITCAGVGTPYDPSRFGPHDASPDCDYVYTRSSYGLPGDQVRATYSITWHVTWTGSTGTGSVGGVLPDLRSQANALMAVAEVQALRSH